MTQSRDCCSDNTLICFCFIDRQSYKQQKNTASCSLAKEAKPVKLSLNSSKKIKVKFCCHINRHRHALSIHFIISSWILFSQMGFIRLQLSPCFLFVRSLAAYYAPPQDNRISFSYFLIVLLHLLICVPLFHSAYCCPSQSGMGYTFWGEGRGEGGG